MRKSEKVLALLTVLALLVPMLNIAVKPLPTIGYALGWVYYWSTLTTTNRKLVRLARRTELKGRILETEMKWVKGLNKELIKANCIAIIPACYALVALTPSLYGLTQLAISFTLLRYLVVSRRFHWYIQLLKV